MSDRPETYAEQLHRERFEEERKAAEIRGEKVAGPISTIACVLLLIDGVAFWLVLWACLFGSLPWKWLLAPIVAASAIVIFALLVTILAGLIDGFRRK